MEGCALSPDQAKANPLPADPERTKGAGQMAFSPSALSGSADSMTLRSDFTTSSIFRHSASARPAKESQETAAIEHLTISMDAPLRQAAALRRVNAAAIIRPARSGPRFARRRWTHGDPG